MKITAFIIFNIIFWGFVWFTCRAIIKEEAAIEKETSNREQLELENTEFDYGHNVNYNKEE